LQVPCELPLARPSKTLPLGPQSLLVLGRLLAGLRVPAPVRDGDRVRLGGLVRVRRAAGHDDDGTRARAAQDAADEAAGRVAERVERADGPADEQVGGGGGAGADGGADEGAEAAEAGPADAGLGVSLREAECKEAGSCLPVSAAALGDWGRGGGRSQQSNERELHFGGFVVK
jgi:hypothetical protein